jgi:hypothetical protein
MTPDTTPLPDHPDTCGTDACVACWLEGELAKAEAERDEAIAKAELSRVCLADFQAVVRERDEARAEVERMRPVVEASVRRRALWIANDHGESTREECLDAGRAEDAAIDAYREHMEATDE